MSDIKRILILQGYAKGNYTCTCAECRKQFTGEKRAYCCFECARGKIIDEIDKHGSADIPTSYGHRQQLTVRGNCLDGKQANRYRKGQVVSD